MPHITEEDLKFDNLNKVIDGFLCPYINGSESFGWEKPLLSDESLDLIEVWNAKKYNEGLFPIDNAAKLHSTWYFNYLIDLIDLKIAGETDLKYVHISAHGGTISGFMAGVET